MPTSLSHNPETEHSGIAVIIPAAGIGSRMGLDGSMPKQFLEIAGIPILVHTLQRFISHVEIDEIIVVVSKPMLEETKNLCNIYFAADYRLQFAIGGQRRQDSVQAGLAICQSPLVMVHDAARPLVDQTVIDRCCQVLRQKKGFIAAVPVSDTIKHVRNNTVLATIARENLVRAQTPQGAPKDILEHAFRINEKTGMECSDEASLLENAGITVSIISGDERNFKITRKEDLLLAQPLLEKMATPLQQEHPDFCTNFRIGHGFDAHRLVEDRELILGGVEIPFEKGLLGHSDADVLTHAVCDALLGAAGEGDIGKAFPDNDDSFKDIYSITLLEHTAKRIGSCWRIVNIDITLICQAPKIGPYVDDMGKNIAVACGIDTSFINIKATTEEKMGYTGRKEGISCHAVALLHNNRRNKR